MTLSPRHAAIVGSLATLVAACAVDNPVFVPVPLDEAFFACEVQPVLDRECSFPGCHGNAERFLAVLSPGRMRLPTEYAVARVATPASDIEAGSYPALTATERRFNFAQMMGFVPPDGPRQDSELLTRPLAVAAGGRYHAPAGDVFSSADDPGYRAIASWLNGARAAQPCP